MHTDMSSRKISQSTNAKVTELVDAKNGKYNQLHDSFCNKGSLCARIQIDSDD